MSNVLVAIAEQSEKVTVNGTVLTARGIDLLEGVALLQRFPQIAVVFGGGASKLAIGEIAKLGRPLLGALIAAGIGSAGDEEVERAAASMGMGNQVKLLAPILRFTMPDGAGPFVEQLTDAVQTIGGGNKAAVADPTRAFRGKKLRQRSNS